MIYALPVDAKRVEDLRTMIDERRDHLSADILFIQHNYSFLVEKIRLFEYRDVTISTALGHLEDILARISNIPGEIGLNLRNKFEQIIARNPDLKIINAINDILMGGYTNHNQKICIDTANFPFYRNCNLTSVDTERAFSRYKMLLNSRRHFKFDNLHKHFFLHCNSFVGDSSNEPVYEQ